IVNDKTGPLSALYELGQALIGRPGTGFRGRLAASSTASWCEFGHRSRYSADPHDVARQHGQFEVLIDSADAAEDGLPQPADRLGPAEVFFDAFADLLTGLVASVPGGAAVDGAATRVLDIHRDVRRHIGLAARLDESGRVVALVRAQGLAPTARDRAHQPHRGLP